MNLIKCVNCGKTTDQTVFTKKRDGNYRVRCDQCTDGRKKYYQQNKEKIQKKIKEWRKDQGEEYRQSRRIYTKKYAKNNPAHVALHEIKKRAKKRNQIFNLSLDDLEKVFKNNTCACCGASADNLDVDRVINDLGYIPDNIQRLCRRCNRLKSNGTIADFEKIIKYIKKYSTKKENENE